MSTRLNKGFNTVSKLVAKSIISNKPAKTKNIEYSNNTFNLLASNIKKLRIENNLTQKQLANALGFSESAIRMWELGKNEPNANTIDKLCNFFSVSSDYLLGRIKDFDYDREMKIIEFNKSHGISAVNDELICKMEILSEKEKKLLLEFIDFLLYKRQK